MEENLGSGYSLSILLFNWTKKTSGTPAGQFSVCNLLCSVHRVGSVFQPQLRSQGQHKIQQDPCQAMLGTNSSGDCPFWLFCRHGRLELVSMTVHGSSMSKYKSTFSQLPKSFLSSRFDHKSWISCFLNSCIHASRINFCPVSLSMSTCIQI